jgi:hypothetical protein
MSAIPGVAEKLTASEGVYLEVLVTGAEVRYKTNSV